MLIPILLAFGPRLLRGLGFILVATAPLTFAAAGRLDPHETGIAVARLNVFNYVGFLLGAPLLTSLWQPGLPYRPGWAIPAALCVLMFVFAYGFSETRTATTKAAPLIVLEPGSGIG